MRALAFALLAVAALAPAAAAAGPFPSHDEVTEALRALDSEPRIHVAQVGASEEGRALWLAVVADPPVESPEDVAGRAVTLLYTQQHGNEPAGTPAALAILEQLAGALGDEVLRDQVVLVMPMVNPDGAETDTRGNRDGTDTNRDHMNLTSATARVLHEVVAAWSPVVVIDHHEYGGLGPGVGPVRTYDWDATILWPKHANVDPAVVEASMAVDEAMRERLREEGYSVGDYGKLTANGVPLADLAGGPTPNIARNHYGLHHAASLLVESRVDDPTPVTGDGAERRIQVHLLTMEATVRHVAERAGDLLARQAEARARERADGDLAFDDGAAVRYPAWGWAVGDGKARDLLRAHGVVLEDENVPAVQPHRHHAGLLVDGRSAWSVADGEPLDLAPGLAGLGRESAPTPLGAWVALAAGAGAAAVARRR